MKPIKLQEVYNKLVKDIMNKNNVLPILYLRDGDEHYHLVNEINLYSDKIKCDDGYFDYTEYIIDDENNKNFNTLFISDEYLD